MIRHLGAGGQADVWLVEDLLLGELSALKIMRGALTEDTERRLRREVTIGRTLSHPNLVRTFDLVELAGRVAVSMEWIPGGTVSQRCAEGPLPLPEISRMAEETLAALAYLHEHRIIHRDIKPSNLLLDENGRIHIGDLGLAMSQKDQSDATRTRMGAGTPTFMSPEQRRGEDLTPATDLYSLGATLFLLITGQQVFEGRSEADTSDQHLHTQPRDPRRLRPECPIWLAKFVLRLLEKRPEDRWPDARLALIALKRRSSSLSPRRIRALVAAACLVLAGAAVAWSLVQLLGRHPDSGPLSFQSQGPTLIASDSTDTERWRYDVGATIRQIHEADLDLDGSNEILVAAAPEGTARRMQPSSVIAVLDRSGRVVTRVLPDREVPLLVGAPLTRASLIPHLIVLDIDGDRRPEIFAMCRHRILGSFFLLVYWPGEGRWTLPLRHEGGWIYNLAAASGSRRLRFFGFNSVIGSLPVVGELLIPPPRAGRPEFGGEGGPGFVNRDGSELSFYTPLTPAPPSPIVGENGFLCDPDGGMAFQSAGRSWRIDAHGNLEGSSTMGQPTGQRRLALLRELAGVASKSASPEEVLGTRERLDESYGDLLRDQPMRSIATLMLSRAFATAGDHHRAVQSLNAEWEGLQWDGLGLALAHLHATGGELVRSRSVLRTTIARSSTPAGTFRAPQLLAHIAIEEKDEQLLAEVLATRGDLASLPSRRRAIEARARLWWDQPSPVDLDLEADDLAPEGEAVACLARWRLGQTQPNDPAAMIEAADSNPDARMEAAIARAASLLALQQPSDALDVIEDLNQPWAAEARWDFRKLQLARLAWALRCRALLQLGRHAAARNAALRLQPTLKPGLLPRIIVDEVLRDTGASSSSPAEHARE